MAEEKRVETTEKTTVTEGAQPRVPDPVPSLDQIASKLSNTELKQTSQVVDVTKQPEGGNQPSVTVHTEKTEKTEKK